MEEENLGRGASPGKVSLFLSRTSIEKSGLGLVLDPARFDRNAQPVSFGHLLCVSPVCEGAVGEVRHGELKRKRSLPFM